MPPKAKGATIKTKLVAALAYPGVQLLDITGPLEAFNIAARQMVEDGDAVGPPYRVTVIGPTPGPVDTMSGIPIVAERGLDQGVGGIHTLLVPGAQTGALDDEPDAPLVRWLKLHGPRVPRLGSVCSGALLLGAAGLLDGRRATTHWMDAARLGDRCSNVRVEANQIYIEDGGVFTSGGITAGIDLALALVERDHGRRLALRTARRMLVFLKRPGDQAQFSPFLEAQSEAGRFGETLDWITAHLDDELDTAEMARHACMSERNFRRRFEAELGLSPVRYVAMARLNKARGMLEMSEAPLAVVARSCGFASADAMRYAFNRELGVTPSAYRTRFGCSAAAARR